MRIIVPFAAGSATDLVPRAVFEQVQQQTGQTFIIENRPGGGTTTGTAAVAKSDPDGYTMLVHSNGFVTTPAIQTERPLRSGQGFCRRDAARRRADGAGDLA